MLTLRNLLEELRSSGVRDIFMLSNDSIVDAIPLCEEYNIRLHGLLAEENIPIAAGVHARYTGKVAAVLASEGFCIHKMINGLLTARIQYLPLLCLLIKNDQQVYPLNIQKQISSIAVEDYLAGKGIPYIHINGFKDLKSIPKLISQIAYEKIPHLLTFCEHSCKKEVNCLRRNHIDEALSSAPLQLSDQKNSINQVRSTAQNHEHDFANAFALVGNGIRYGDNEKCIVQLIEQLDIPYAILPSSKSCLPELHKNFAGCYYGKYSSESVKNLFRSKSLLLQICVEEYPFDFYKFEQFLDELALEKKPKVITVSAESFLNFADACFEQGFSGHSLLFETDKQMNMITNQRVMLNRLSESLSSPDLSPKIVLSDLGCSCLCSLNIQLYETDHYVSNHASASMAMSLASAIGIAASTSPVPLWIVIGDGSLLMALNDLPILSSMNSNINIILLDNQQYLTENLRFYSQLHVTPAVDWKMLMHSFGVKHYQEVDMEKSQDIDMILSSAWMHPHISLIHILLSKGAQENNNSISQLFKFLN